MLIAKMAARSCAYMTFCADACRVTDARAGDSGGYVNMARYWIRA